MTRLSMHRCAWLAGLLALVGPWPAQAQSSAQKPTGRVSVYVNTAGRDFSDGARQRNTDLSTSVTFESPRNDDNGLEYGLQLRETKYSTLGTPNRVSIYDGYAGAKFGGDVQLRVRAGHMWLQDLGTMGALGGGLFEVGRRRSGDADTSGRFRAGVFGGLEPKMYETGYAPDVKKYGGYAAYERGFMERHVIGYTTVTQGNLIERSVLSITNFIPGGRKFFAYQAAEYELKGPADGAVDGGLSYFLTNARMSTTPWLDFNATYNRGRSLDARQLTNDLLNGRALTAQAVEGLKYESAGGRVTVEVVRRTWFYAGYTRDRTNRDDAASGRVLLGGHSSNVFGSGFDVSASDSRIQRSTGPYHSSYVSVGHALGRSAYVSIDYSTSLSVIHLLRSDGVLIETKPSTRRYTGSTSVTLNRSFSLMGTVDYTLDDTMNEIRVLSGLSYRIR